jgi:RNA polymerase sigma factor for flagellar operon FliA
MRHTCASPSNGALETLVTTHGALVRAIAVNIHSKLPVHVELCDLVQEGMRGLIDAATRYDPRRGVAFTTYAKYRVRGAILDGLRQFDPASRAFRTTSKKLEAAEHELADELGRTPTESEVAARAAVDLPRWTRHSETSQALRAASLSGETATGLVPEVASEDASEETSAMHSELQGALNAVMSRLPSRTREILTLYHWRGLTMREIGLRYGINESRVSQIHKRALGLMAVALREQGITGLPSVLPA